MGKKILNFVSIVERKKIEKNYPTFFEKKRDDSMTWKDIIKFDRDLYSRDLSNKKIIRIAEKDMEYRKKIFDSIQDMIHYSEDNRELHLALQKVSKLMSKDLKFWRDNLVGLKEEISS